MRSEVCLYAVYTFLQDVVGVRWWTPEDTFIPKKPTLVVADDLLVSDALQMTRRDVPSKHPHRLFPRPA